MVTTEEAIARMRAIVLAKRESLAYAAPEMQGLHWTDLADSLEALITEIYEEEREASDGSAGE